MDVSATLVALAVFVALGGVVVIFLLLLPRRRRRR
jgi:hypothetical protein